MRPDNKMRQNRGRRWLLRCIDGDHHSIWVNHYKHHHYKGASKVVSHLLKAGIAHPMLFLSAVSQSIAGI